MWGFLKAAVLVALLGAGVFAYRDQVRTFALQAYREARPCTVPISYAVEKIDARFDISTSTLLKAIANAEELWEAAAGKQLFAHDKEGGLKISLVYDIRQATTEKLTELGVSVEENLGTYEDVKARYSAALSEYQRDKQAFDAAYPAYEREAASYEADVRRWNARGGAPESVFGELEKRQAALHREEARLQSLQDAVNDGADEVNALARHLNQLAGELNISVASYNTVGSSVGEEFEEAVYESTPGSQTIDIFEYDSIAGLTRVLAHELGHALGLEHVEDEEAIMYRLNHGKDIALTEADRGALGALCRL